MVAPYEGSKYEAETERVDKALKTEEDYFYDSKEIDANLQPRKSE